MTAIARVLAGILLLLPLAGGGAEAIEIDARADRTDVDADGKIALTLTVRGGQGEPEVDLGSTTGFEIYSAGTSQSISIVNGQVSSSITYTYLLSPRGEGEFTIGPFEARIGGEAATAPAIRIRVTPGASSGAPPPRESAPRPSRGGEARDVFLTTALDKKDAYVGEAIILSFRLYTRVRFAGDPEYEPPSTEGFWKEDLPPQRRFFDDWGGLRYSVTEVKSALFPTRPGRLVVGPARLAYVEDAFFSADPFDLLLGRGTSRRRGAKETIRSDSIAVRVLPLPEAGRPPDFGGAVGSFTLQASLDKTETAANEPVTLALTIEGEGNIQAATVPEPRVPESFKVYDSGTSTETSKEGYRVRGKKTYTRVLVPRYGGDYEIAPVSFSYFDPDEGEYVTRTAGPFRVRVDGPPPEEETDRMEIARKEEDIRYIKEPAAIRWEARDERPSLFALLGWNVLPLVAFGAALLAHKRRERYARDPAWARARRAERVARGLLDAARSRAGDPDSREFASALSRALVGFLSDKGGIAAAGMTRREIERVLQGKGADAPLRERVLCLLETCDRARYAALPLPSEERGMLLAEGEEVLRGLEKLFAESRT